MRKLVVVLLLLISHSSIALANDKYEAIKSKIYEAMDTGDMNHQSWDEAAQLLKPLLEADEPEAYFYSSYFYAYGAGGFPADINIAIKNEFKAANMGSVSAMVSHARRYEYGVSKPMEFNEALFWYQRAAEAGSRSAANRLKNAYQKGELGLAKNEALASKWEEIACECEKP